MSETIWIAWDSMIDDVIAAGDLDAVKSFLEDKYDWVSIWLVDVDNTWTRKHSGEVHWREFIRVFERPVVRVASVADNAADDYLESHFNSSGEWIGGEWPYGMDAHLRRLRGN